MTTSPTTDGNETAKNEERDLFGLISGEFFTQYKKSLEHARSVGKIDELRYARLYTTALCAVASVIAVDTAMNEDQFLTVCKSSFRSAYQQAEKFG